MRFTPCLLALLVSVASPCLHAQTPAAEMTTAAESFLGSLDPAHRARAVFPLASEERENFHYIPRERLGLPLKDMNARQRTLASALLRAGLSSRSISQIDAIIALELVLREMEQDSVRRDPEKYFVSIFGTPSAVGNWGWRFEGHHVSVNFTVAGGKVSGTPSFLGSNPAELRSGPQSGQRVFTDEEDIARELVKSLDDSQRSTAIIAGSAPREIFTAANRKVDPLSPAGLPTTRLTRQQSDRLMTLLRTFVFRHREGIAEQDLKDIMDAGWDRVHFAWAGGFEKGEPHYYRIQGPTFVIEYDNVQNGANHVHSVWRDFEGDFGRDLLGEHYQRDHSAK